MLRMQPQTEKGKIDDVQSNQVLAPVATHHKYPLARLPVFTFPPCAVSNKREASRTRC